MLSKHSIDLLRHGECEGGHIFRGTTDVALNTQGWQSMQRSLDVLCNSYKNAHAPYMRIISSPLQRCRIFSEHCAKNMNVTLEILPDIKEFYFGDWEGKNIDDIWEKHGALADAWYRDPEHCGPPNAEAYTDFRARVRRGLNTIIEHAEQGPLLVILHAGVIRALLAEVLKLSAQKSHILDVPYTCTSRLSAHFHKDSPAHITLTAHNLCEALPS